MYKYKYPRPAVTADAIVFAFDGKKLYVLLIERAQPPFKGFKAFPGGFLEVGKETLHECARRELEEETHLHIVQLQPGPTASPPQRDPRSTTITQAFLSLIHPTHLEAADDASSAQWIELEKAYPLAFDHEKLLLTALTYFRDYLQFPLSHSMWDKKEWNKEELAQILNIINAFLLNT